MISIRPVSGLCGWRKLRGVRESSYRRMVLKPALVLALTSLAWIQSPAQPVFTLGFDGCNRLVEGPAGSTVFAEVFATLGGQGVGAGDGPQGWQVSISLRGDPQLDARVAVADLNLTVNTWRNGTSYAQYLAGSWYRLAEPATLSTNSSIRGAISAVVLDSTGQVLLQMPGPQRILRLVISAKIPDTESDLPLAIAFEDNMQGTTNDHQVVNGVSYGGVTLRPVLGSCELRFRKSSSLLDIGLRTFDGTATNRIACEAPGLGGTLSSPLRIARNGTNYGILLVQTDATDASRIQVQTSAGIKAWKKLPQGP